MVYRSDDEFMDMDDAVRGLLLRWRKNCLRSQIGNYDASNWFAKINYWIGIPATVLSAVVATSVFATLQTQAASWAKITVGLLSVIAALLAALQTFLRLGERSSKHRTIAAEYGGIKREIDLLLVNIKSNQPISDTDVELIRKRMDSLSKDAPEMPEHLWQAVHSKVPSLKYENQSVVSFDENEQDKLSNDNK